MAICGEYTTLNIIILRNRYVYFYDDFYFVFLVISFFPEGAVLTLKIE